MKRKTKFVRWLYSELPSLVSNGAISEENAGKIKAHYGEISEVNTGRLTLAILSVTGALLIGGGIILLLAHNWASMTRECRAAVSFIPLVISQITACYAMLKKRESTAWKEASATAWTVCVIACMSLICQTYNMGGDFNFFWFICIALSLPSVYLLDSVTACILCMAGITFGLGYSRFQSENPLCFWSLVIAIMPYIIYSFRKYMNSLRNVYLSFAVIISMLFISGMVSGNGEGLWVVSFTALLSVFYLLSVTMNKENFPSWVFKYAGMSGILILSMVLSYQSEWHGSHYYRDTQFLYADMRRYIEYIYTGLLILLDLYFIIQALAGKKYEAFIWGFAAIPAGACYLLTEAYSNKNVPPPSYLFNIFLAILGITMLTKGLKLKSLSRINWGMIIIALLIVLRFFDSNIDFIIKGLIFIIIGIIILAFNIYLAKKIKAN